MTDTVKMTWAEACKANKKFVRAIATEFVRPGLDLEDLIQEASFGLLRALEEWDPNGGSSFKTIANLRIRDVLKVLSWGFSTERKQRIANRAGLQSVDDVPNDPTSSFVSLESFIESDGDANCVADTVDERINSLAESNPEDDLIRAETEARLALELSPPYQDTSELRAEDRQLLDLELKGQTRYEIAETLRFPVSTYSRRRDRAIERISSVLNEGEEDEPRSKIPAQSTVGQLAKAA